MHNTPAALVRIDPPAALARIDPPAALAHIAPPADAQRVDEWVDVAGTGTTWGRYIQGTRRGVAGVQVVVVGWQDADGQVDRHASVWATDVALDAASLRELAAVLIAAADELTTYEMEAK